MRSTLVAFAMLLPWPGHEYRQHPPPSLNFLFLGRSSSSFSDSFPSVVVVLLCSCDICLISLPSLPPPATSPPAFTPPPPLPSLSLLHFSLHHQSLGDAFCFGCFAWLREGRRERTQTGKEMESGAGRERPVDTAAETTVRRERDEEVGGVLGAAKRGREWRGREGGTGGRKGGGGGQ